MKPANKIWLNGKITSISGARFLNFNQGLNYGACIYEGIRFYKTSKCPGVFRLREHTDRFFYSAKTLGMDLGLTKGEFMEAIKQTIRANKLSSGYLRPLAYYSEPKMGINIIGSELTLSIFVWPWRDEINTKRVCMKIVKTRRLDPSTVDFKAKIGGYYANSLLGFLEARRAGFDEPLFLDTKGFIAEGAINNIFIVRSGILYTPESGNILSGITRDSIIKIAGDLGIKVVEKKLRPEFLRLADEIFLTGTGIELERVGKIQNFFDKKSDVTKITDKLQDRYREIVSGRIKKYFNWIDLL